MSGSAIDTARSCRYFLAERAKTARQFIKGIAHPLPLMQIEVQDWEAHTIAEHWKWLQLLLEQGEDVCLVSEAGAPCEEGFYGELVGGVEDRAAGATLLHDLERQGHGGEACPPASGRQAASSQGRADRSQ